MTVDRGAAQDLQRWDMHCHDCGKNFVAQLDHRIEGNHVVLCPHCGHEHCRVITGGAITGERWDTRYGRTEVSGRCVWAIEGHPIVTSTAAMFLRDRWLNRG